MDIEVDEDKQAAAMYMKLIGDVRQIVRDELDAAIRDIGFLGTYGNTGTCLGTAMADAVGTYYHNSYALRTAVRSILRDIL